MAELEIRNLHVSAEDKEILKGLDLDVEKGKIHALMGPNGSGKSTLANAIMGHPALEVTEGTINFKGEDITEADPDERSRAGLFMAFQYPVAIPGVTVTKYLRMIAQRPPRGARRGADQAQGLPQRGRRRRWSWSTSRRTSPAATSTTASRAARRSAWRSCSSRCCSRRSRSSTRPTRASTSTRCAPSPTASTRFAGPDMGVLIITHYQRILHLVEPDFVHVMFEGRIVKQGGPELVEQLEEKGYGWIREEVEARPRA